MSPLLPILGRRGRVADLVADAVVMMMRAIADRESPYELETVTFKGADGKPWTVKRFPAEWARRLARAVEAGAFKRRDVRSIVETILTTPEPVATRSVVENATGATASSSPAGAVEGGIA